MKSLFMTIKNFLLKTRRRKIIVFVIVLLIVAMQINLYLKADHEVNVIEVERNTFVDTISASGEIKAERYTELVFLSSGDIAEVYVSDGSYVEKGDRIATVDSTTAYQAYLQAEADLRAKEATLARVYDAIQDSEEDESFTEIETRTLAETAKDKSYRAYIAAQKALGNTTLRAPFNGIVQYVNNVSVGSYAAVTKPSFIIVNPETIYFEAEVSEIEVSELELNMQANIQLDAYPSDEYNERVEMIGITNVTTSTGGTAYIVKVSLPENMNNKFRVGMSGDIEFVVKEEDNVLAVPFSAVVEENGNNYVWQVVKGSTVKKIEVEIGNTSLDSIEILSGISQSDMIVERPPNDILEGDKVKDVE